VYHIEFTNYFACRSHWYFIQQLHFSKQAFWTDWSSITGDPFPTGYGHSDLVEPQAMHICNKHGTISVSSFFWNNQTISYGTKYIFIKVFEISVKKDFG